MEELYEEKFKNLNIRVDNCENRITENDKRISFSDKEFAVALQGINSALGTLSSLPNVIAGIDKTIGQMKSTMELMQVELRRNTEEIATVKSDIANNSNSIKQLDEEGKFNIRLWLKNNWIVVVIGAVGILNLIEYLSIKFPN